MLDTVLPVDKPLGMTPLELLDELRIQMPELSAIRMSYAGRLDPMASGLMLVLVGAMNNEREAYLGLSKQYRFEILAGISTDTGDILGIPAVAELGKSIGDWSILDTLEGEITLAYPPYSAKPVLGKPLWWWARQHRLDEISVPNHTTSIYSLSYVNSYQLTLGQLRRQIKQRISLVTGDFRQDIIIDAWDRSLAESNVTQLWIHQLHLHCSSGTYVRSLVEAIGRLAGTQAMAYSIRRTHIGMYGLNRDLGRTA